MVIGIKEVKNGFIIEQYDTFCSPVQEICITIDGVVARVRELLEMQPKPALSPEEIEAGCMGDTGKFEGWRQA